VLFKSEVRCLLSTGAPALRSLQEIGCLWTVIPISKILENYLRGRKEQIKLQGVVSGCQILQKGVPQGSIMGSLLFNIFYKKYFLLY
jgi:hypothetical protein